MKQQAGSTVFLILLCLLYIFASVDAQTCRPSGTIRGKNPPPGQCNTENDSDCCKVGKLYTTYKCSPPVSSHTKATLTLNSFQAGGDGGGPSECDNQYHSDDDPVVALSTGWFNNKKRCLKYINIYGNGRSVRAKVVDECDSTMGCDSDHDYQPPCPNNIVDASKAVWKALGVPETSCDTRHKIMEISVAMDLRIERAGSYINPTSYMLLAPSSSDYKEIEDE
ncbi:hypothetical protein V6N13_045572 [Hibiscus sabdariffa]